MHDKKEACACFLELMNSLNVDYAVLRGENILAHGPDGDLDVLLAKKHVGTVLLGITASAELTVTFCWDKSSSFHMFVMCSVEKTKVVSVVQIDLIHQIDYKGIELVSVDSIVKRARQAEIDDSVFRKVTAADELLCTLITYGLVRRLPYPLSAKEKELLSDDSIRASVVDEQVIPLVKEMIMMGVVSRVAAYAFLLRRFIRGPCVFCQKAFEYAKAEYRIRNQKKFDFEIVFLGIDGSGKSTLIESLQDSLERHSKGVVLRYLRPMVLKSTADSKSNKTASHPHSGSAHGSVGSVLKVIYFIADYWLDSAFTVRRQPKVILYDRHFSDLIADRIRYRLSCGTLFLRLMLRFIPKPNLVVFLIGEEKELVERKDELELHQAVLLQREYRKLNLELSNYTNTCVLNAVEPLESNLAKLLGLVHEMRDSTNTYV